MNKIFESRNAMGEEKMCGRHSCLPCAGRSACATDLNKNRLAGTYAFCSAFFIPGDIGYHLFSFFRLGYLSGALIGSVGLRVFGDEQDFKDNKKAPSKEEAFLREEETFMRLLRPEPYVYCGEQSMHPVHRFQTEAQSPVPAPPVMMLPDYLH